MASLRKPKRVGLFGDDGKEDLFLVKGGEDLRNDERIEQLLTLMNHVLAADGAAASAGLACIRTYSVVPMTTNIGLIEWVSDTQPVKGLIEGGLDKDLAFRKRNDELLGAIGARRPGPSEHIAVSGPGQQYFAPSVHYNKSIKAMGAAGGAKGGNEYSPDSYHAMFKSASVDTVSAIYAQTSGVVPWDLLRRELFSLAPHPEEFLTMRNEFARSLATFSIAGYVLGIGDRHLDNYLIDKRSGEIVPIDFGASFGLAHAALPVPEYIPIRLGPQFMGILRPLDSLGLLKHHCTLAMQVAN